jgi:hypothetical protein
LLDRYLARGGYDGQLADEPSRERADNLWQPVPGDPGAHGRFDAIARDHGASFGLLANRALLLLMGAGIGAAGIAASHRWRRRAG